MRALCYNHHRDVIIVIDNEHDSADTAAGFITPVVIA
jgi:hypothetical protein